MIHQVFPEDAESPSRIIASVYTRSFAENVAREFKINISREELLRELRYIECSYDYEIIIKYLFDENNKHCANYRAQLQCITKFRKLWHRWTNDSRLASLMADEARTLGCPSPNAYLGTIKAHQRRGREIYQELLRLLALAESTMMRAAGRSTTGQWAGRLKHVAKFQSDLRQWDAKDLATMLADATLPPGSLSPLSHAYDRALSRLVELAEMSLQSTIRQVQIPRGRRAVRYGLDTAIRRAANFWMRFNPLFSFDHNNPISESPAFQFVQKLIKAIDKELSDKQIITALRAWRKWRNRLNAAVKASESCRSCKISNSRTNHQETDQ